MHRYMVKSDRLRKREIPFGVVYPAQPAGVFAVVFDGPVVGVLLVGESLKIVEKQGVHVIISLDAGI